MGFYKNITNIEKVQHIYPQRYCDSFPFIPEINNIYVFHPLGKTTTNTYKCIADTKNAYETCKQCPLQFEGCAWIACSKARRIDGSSVTFREI